MRQRMRHSYRQTSRPSRMIYLPIDRCRQSLPVLRGRNIRLLQITAARIRARGGFDQAAGGRLTA
jgi:hypothetical protein